MRDPLAKAATVALIVAVVVFAFPLENALAQQKLIAGSFLKRALELGSIWVFYVYLCIDVVGEQVTV